MKVDRTTSGIALAAIVAMGASAILLLGDYRSEAENHRRVMLARGQTALESLAAGIRAQGRMGRYRDDRLSLIFEELAATPDIIGVVLHTVNGQTISSGGETAAIDLHASIPDLQWAPGTLTLRREIVLELGGHGMGRGRGAFVDPNAPNAETWEPLPEGPHALTIVLDTRPMEAEIRGDRLRLGVSLSGAALLVALGSVVALGAGRRRHLQTALLLAQEQAVHQEQLTQLGAGLAHETKNPLGIVRGQAQLIADTPDDSDGNRVRAAQIVDEIDRTVGHINGFLTLARPRDIDARPLALGPFLEAFGTLMEGEAKQHQVLLSVEAPDVWVWADESQLRKALLNLVLNGLQACGPADRIAMETASNGSVVSLRVRDTGRGIASEDLPRVREPYFTRFEGGCGLGLSLVDQIARAHGWTLDLDSTPGRGTTASLNGIKKVAPPRE